MTVKVRKQDLVKTLRQYVKIKQRLDAMEKTKKELALTIKSLIPERGKLRAFNDPDDANLMYVVKIMEIESKRLDQDLVKKFLTDEQAEVCTKVVKTERMTVEATDISVA